APPRIGVLENVRHDHAAIAVRRNGGAERRVVDDPATAQVTEKMLDLVDRDRIPDTDIDAPALLERAPPIDADELAVGVEQRAARVTWIDGGIGLDAVGVFEQRAGRILITVNARDDAVGKRRLEIGRQQERITDREAPIPDADRVAIGHFRGGKIIATE